MGDRGNIIIKHGKGQYVHVYTHHRGFELTDILRNALEPREDWNDATYLTGAIVKCMGHNSSVGVSLRAQDNERPVLLVDPDKRIVTKWSAGRYDSWDKNPPGDNEMPMTAWTFEAFVRIHRACPVCGYTGDDPLRYCEECRDYGKH